MGRNPTSHVRDTFVAPESKRGSARPCWGCRPMDPTTAILAEDDEIVRRSSGRCRGPTETIGFEHFSAWMAGCRRRAYTGL